MAFVYPSFEEMVPVLNYASYFCSCRLHNIGVKGDEIVKAGQRAKKRRVYIYKQAHVEQDGPRLATIVGSLRGLYL